MVWQLPPLAAIRAFEAAARLGSFTKAAEELGMTQAAVSYQIKILEERFGASLFVRKTREISLTEAGGRLAPRALEAFALLSESWESARNGAAGILSVTTLQTFASNWLAGRLGEFQLMHPRIAVRLDASSRLVDLSREEFDLGIRTGSGNWPGLIVHFLFKADYTPMLSPGLAESVGGIRIPADLYKLPFLGPGDPWWANWFAAAGETFQPERVIQGPTLGVQALESIAAMNGQGVAILSRDLYPVELAQHRLLQPFEAVGSDGDGYWLVYPESRRNAPKVRAFRDWILAKTATIRDRDAG